MVLSGGRGFALIMLSLASLCSICFNPCTLVGIIMNPHKGTFATSDQATHNKIVRETIILVQMSEVGVKGVMHSAEGAYPSLLYGYLSPP